MELNKNDTKMLQGLSVLAMVCLHLFDRDYNGLFVPLIFVQGIPLSFYIAQLSDFCVFGFAFCSGYAHMKQFGSTGYYKRRLKGLLSVLCSYELILVIFTVISILTGQAETMPGNAKTFIMHVLTLAHSYNGAWWYMFAYLLLVLVSPILLKAVNQIHPVLVLGISFAIYCVAYYIRFNISTDNLFLLKFGPFGMTLFEYLIGAVCCKMQIFSKLYIIWRKPNKMLRYLIAVVLVAGMLYGHTKVIASLFIAPVTGFVIIMLFHFWRKPKAVQSAFLFIGKHSTNIWLTHMFFYLVLFKDFVYIAKYPVMIYLFMLVITVALSILLQVIEQPIQRLIAKT